MCESCAAVQRYRGIELYLCVKRMHPPHTVCGTALCAILVCVKATGTCYATIVHSLPSGDLGEWFTHF